MKSIHNYLFLLCLATLSVVTSCEKQHISPEPAPTVSRQDDPLKGNDGHWETTDEKTKAAIVAELTAIAHPKPGAKITATTLTQTYRGFTIKYTSSTPSDIIGFAKKEIDQIYSADVKSATRTNMATVRAINLMPTSRGGLFYDGGNLEVVITDFALYRNIKSAPGNVIFHECTHYYHHKFLPGSWNNTTNNANWRDAVAKKIYASGQYVLSNSAEYFAVNTEAYFTATNREPYNRSRETSKDPKEASFVRSTF